MKFEVLDKKIDEIQSDLELIFVLEKDFSHRFIKDEKVLKSMNYKANTDEIAYLPESGRIYIGIESKECALLTDATSNAIKKAISTNAKNIKVALYFEQNIDMSIKYIVEGICLGAYKFDKYKSKKSSFSLKTIYISNETDKKNRVDVKLLKKIISNTQKICESVNFTRDIVNGMPDEITPIKLGEIASKMAKNSGIECKIYDEKYLQKNSMNAFYSVARASIHPPRLIHLSYTPKKPKAKIVLVGKGLTYDSGGLSLKPSDFMVTMKSDKSGASASIGIIKAVAELKLNIELHVVVGAAENMVAGNAYKPDDILVAKSGKTIEVRNTDAEGRLVLADCLCFAQELKPDYIVDIATLTGACVVAVGEYTIGVMGFNEKLKSSMIDAAKASGELASSLEFNKYLKKLIKSEIADVCNIASSRYGGAITAALFLSEFIEERYKDKWLHLDIAGPAYVEKEWGCNPHGGSGAGVRMVVEWLKNLQ